MTKETPALSCTPKALPCVGKPADYSYDLPKKPFTVSCIPDGIGIHRKERRMR